MTLLRGVSKNNKPVTLIAYQLFALDPVFRVFHSGASILCWRQFGPTKRNAWHL